MFIYDISLHLTGHRDIIMVNNNDKCHHACMPVSFYASATV